MPQQPSIEALQEKVEKLTAENLALREENERLENIALKDPLTGMFNRRGLMETASYFLPQKKKESEEERSVDPERQRAIAILIADIDNFKIVNDAYSHPVGDMVLKRRLSSSERISARRISFRGGAEKSSSPFSAAPKRKMS